MQVEWITVGAQVLNFTVLVLLLRHFLYARITGVIDRRQEEMASRREDAERARTEAEEERSRHRQKVEEIEEKRDEMLADVREQAEEERQRRLERARNEVEDARDRWVRGLQRQKETLLRDLREQAGSATYAAVERALRDLATEELEARVVERFLDRLEESADDEQLRRAMADGEARIVRSAFDLEEALRDRIRSTLSDVFGGEGQPKFTRDPDLILGLRLEVGDYVIGWSGRDYVRDLEERVGAILDRNEREATAESRDGREERTEGDRDGAGDRDKRNGPGHPDEQEEREKRERE